MLAQFDLFGFGEEAEECSFVAIEESGFLGEDFFGGAQDYWIFVPEAGDKFAKAVWPAENELSHFVCAADGAAVARVEKTCDRRFRHLIEPLDVGGLFL